MDGWKQLFFLFLPVCACVDNRVSVVKTVGREPDITPICTSTESSVIILVKCLINTQTHSGDKCMLLYAVDKKFVNECDSRFTLRYKNDSVFIHLVTLTPEDSGNYTCECSYERGTRVVRLDITVEGGPEKRFSSVKFIASLAIAVTVIAMSVVTAWIICDHIQRRNYHRENTRSPVSATSTRCETPWYLDQDDVYVSLQHPDSDVYHTFHPTRAYRNTEEDPANGYSNLEDGREKDLHEFTVYETIQN